MKEMRRIIALVLSLVMVIGMVPVSAFAAETPLAAAIFASDVHEESTSLTGSGTSAWKSVLSKIGSNGVSYNTVGLVGDTYTDIAGTMANMTTATQTALGQNAEVYYAWGDHDEESDISENSGLLYSGDHYYIYHISDNVMRSKAGATDSNVEAAVSAFETAVASMDTSKVLFIMSHAPLHARRDESTYAQNWYDAVTAVADTMDVVFFWAHNHTGETEVDEAAYYVAKNGTETMDIEYGETGVTPNFTYMNAGYIYAAGQNPSRKGVATTVEIYADKMVFQDYNSSGKYTDSTYSHNVEVDRQFASTGSTEETIAPTTEATEPSVELDKIEALGTTAYTVGDELTFTSIKGYAYSTEGTTTVDIDPVDCQFVMTCDAHETCADVETAMNKAVDYENGEYHKVKVIYGDYETEYLFTVSAADETKDDTTGVSVSVSAEVSGTVTIAKDEEGDYSSLFDGSYAAYDITTATALQPGNKATVTLPIPEGVSNPVVYYVDDNGEATNMEATVNGDNVVFTTDHFSTYVVGESTEITVSDPETEKVEGSSSKEQTVYVLTTTLTSGENYLIVDANSTSGNAITNSSNSVGNTAVTINSGSLTIDGTTATQTYIILGDSDSGAVWTAGTNSSNYTFKNGSYYIYHDSGNLSLSTSTSKNNWTWNSSSKYLYYTGGSTTRYLTYDDGWTLTTSTANVYLYKEETATVSTSVSGTYSIAGDPAEVTQVVESGVTTTANLGYTISFLADGGTTATALTEAEITALGGTLKFEEVSGGDPLDVLTVTEAGVVTFTGTHGTALVKVSYTWGDNDEYTITNYITVEATEPTYSIEITDNGTVVTETIVVKGETAMNAGYQLGAQLYYEDADGKETATTDTTKLTWASNNTAVATVDANGKVSFVGEGEVQITAYYEIASGEQITDVVTFSVSKSAYTIPSDGTDDFPHYPDQGAIRFDKTAVAQGTFSQTGIAKIELSMTGVPMGTPLDIVAVIDWTGSMNNDAGSDTRYEAAVAATKAFVQTIMLATDGSLNEHRLCILAFKGNDVGQVSLTGTTEDDTSTFAFESITQEYLDANYPTSDLTDSADDADTTAGVYEQLVALCEEKLTVKISSGSSSSDPGGGGGDSVSGTFATATASGSSGTYYSTAMEEAYDLLTGTTYPKGEERQQFCVFMSDGAPTNNYYGVTRTYDSDGKVTGWTKSDSAYTSSNITGWVSPTNQESYDSSVTMTTTVKEEYYSTVLKEKYGVTMFTVGLGLTSGSSGVSGYESLGDYSYQVLGEAILGAMASVPKAGSTITSYFSSVADTSGTSGMVATFKKIANSILDAATNVVVEDKIASNYTVNFSLPSGVTATEAGMENFYIQVLGYELDDNNERMADPTVLEKFTFNDDGTAVASHTVAGVACGDSCSHVTFTDGEVTAINGTYFSYSKTTDSEGKVSEFLTWNASKLDRTELALEYFVYLKNSAGEVAPEDQIAAGTYNTNEYATITYKNFNNKECQQYFPVPSMTWKGAKVTYVFYLVNEAGQPVSLAGKEIPFAEAVYVTDPITFDVTWNDQASTTNMLAENLMASAKVPEVYELYDEDAAYVIRVYQTEDVDNNGVNGNYFQISGATDKLIDSAMDTDTDVDNSTTKVFNTKAGKKYDAYGIYSAYVAGTELTDGTNKITTTVQATDIDYANTTVAFAVVWRPRLETDTVVIDYGLDVVINVAENDNMASGVVGVRVDAPATSTGTIAINSGAYDTTTAKVDTVDVYIDADGDNTKELKIGTASVANLTSVRFSLDKTNGMQMNKPAVFYYESDCNYYTYDTGNPTLNTKRMYSSVIVIPASTVYYEDEYVTLKNYTSNGTDADGNTTYAEAAGWDTNSVAASATQAVDRPGYDMISNDYDADNAYGYDAAYATMSQYSMGNAAKVNVYAGKYATAEFEFYGTGFDIISLTDSTTGVIVVDVYKDGEKYLSETVNNYYGYKFEDGAWVVTNNASDPNALYQVPVLKIGDGQTTAALPYGKYKAVITVTYIPFLDSNKTDTSYNFYLDAIRIYNPVAAGTVVGKDGEGDDAKNLTIEDIYAADGELYPTYQELRDIIITADTFDSLTTDSVSGIAFIDGNATLTSVSDYTNYGPNNELYLTKGQAVTFNLNASNGVASGYAVDSVQIAMKAVDSDGAVAKLYNVASDGTASNTIEKNLATATDMYYDITALDNGTVVITNTGDGILSITNVKITAKAAASAASNVEDGLDENNNNGVSTASLDDLDSGIAVASLDETSAVAVASTDETETAATASVFSVSRSATNAALLSMAPAAEEEETEPEATEPSEPEETDPSEPEETDPSEPEETDPSEPETEPTEPEEETKPGKPGKPSKPGNGNKPGNNNKPGNGNKNPVWDRFKDAVEFIFGWLLK